MIILWDCFCYSICHFDVGIILKWWSAVSSLNFFILYEDDFALIHCLHAFIVISFWFWCFLGLDCDQKFNIWLLLWRWLLRSLMSSILFMHQKIYSYFMSSSFFKLVLSVFLMIKHYKIRLCAIIIYCQINFFYPLNRLSQKPFWFTILGFWFYWICCQP